MNRSWKVSLIGVAIAGTIVAGCGGGSSDISSDIDAGAWAPKPSVSSTAPSASEVQPGGTEPRGNTVPPAQKAPGFTISPTSGPPETVVAVKGAGCRGFDSAIVQITDEGFETEGASVAPIAADGSWSTTVKMPPAPIPGLDPYPGSWAYPDHVYRVIARCVARGPEGPSPIPPKDVLRLPSQPFDLLAAPAPRPSTRPALFAGFWPVTTEAEAASNQRSFDEGHQPWRGDPEAVARVFADSFAGWKIEVDGSDVTGSSRNGWNATVRFRAYIGEEPLQPISRHTLRLVGLRGSEHPVWFVAGLSSDNIQVRTPADGAIVSSPLLLVGRASAYEGNVLVEVRDDSGRRLFAGNVQAGSSDLTPFEARLAFTPATTRGGLLVLSGDRGAGPVPDMTILRIGFEQVG